MVDVSVRTRRGDKVRVDVYLPEEKPGTFPVLLGASPYQKALRRLPPMPAVNVDGGKHML